MSTRSIPRFVLPLSLLACLAIGPAARAATPEKGTVALSARSHGVQLSIRIPNMVFAANSLIKATIQVKNTTSHAVEILAPNCLADNPTVVVSDSSGKQVYPPAVAPLIPPPCPPLPGQALARKQKATKIEYIV